MKYLIFMLIIAVSSSSFARDLDLRRFQYPVEDARESAKTPVPRFCTYIARLGGKPRIPGVGSDKVRIVVGKYRTQLMNEYRLYDRSEVTHEEKMLLERYCSRYNRMLMRELGL